jgi:hypothetical protein
MNKPKTYTVRVVGDDADGEVHEIAVNPEHAHLLDFEAIAEKWAAKHADHLEADAIRQWAIKTSQYYMVGYEEGRDTPPTESEVMDWFDMMFPMIVDFRNGHPKHIPHDKERDGEIH